LHLFYVTTELIIIKEIETVTVLHKKTQGRRNEMKGAGAKLQKGQFLQIKGRSFCQL